MRLTVRDVAELLNVSEKTIYRWVSKAEIPVYRLKEQYRFSKAEILEWASSRRMPIAESAFRQDDDRENTPLPDLSKAIEAGGIFYRVAGENKDAVLRSIVNFLRLPDDVDRDFLYRILLAREAMGSTGVGDGIAVPHVRNPIVLNVEDPTITLCFLEKPIEFSAIDGKPVKILFTIISPTVRSHLHLLSQIAFALHDPAFKSALTREAGHDEILKELRRIESEILVHEKTGTKEGA